jgi:predicted dinucleotide-binding enzyme
VERLGDAVPFLKFKDAGSVKSDWTGQIVIDVTNAFMLPAEVQEAELKGVCHRRLTLIACPVRNW